jgi:hypothetical protein
LSLPRLRADGAIRSVKGDGNCLFRAISITYYGHEDNHTMVRNDICDTMRSNLAYFAGIYDEDVVAQQYGDKSYARIDVYIATMAHDGEWGDDLCCAAFQCRHPNFFYYIWRPILRYELPSIQQPATRR